MIRDNRLQMQTENLQIICIIVDVRHSWITSHRMNLYAVSRKLFRNSVTQFPFRTIVVRLAFFRE
jgi:hypothetical protein